MGKKTEKSKQARVPRKASLCERKKTPKKGKGKDKAEQKQQKCEQKQKGNEKATKDRSLPAACAYKPGDFSQERKKFIAESGLPYKLASDMWNRSERRAELLSHLPKSELVRRKFVAPEKKRASKKS